MLRRHYSRVILSNNANPDNLHKEGERNAIRKSLKGK